MPLKLNKNVHIEYKAPLGENTEDNKGHLLLFVKHDGKMYRKLVPLTPQKYVDDGWSKAVKPPKHF